LSAAPADDIAGMEVTEMTAAAMTACHFMSSSPCYSC
jgi:hypothetical protein